MERARPCPCGCLFRHRHGNYTRFIVVGAEEFTVLIPRLYCPSCEKTVAVRPWFLGPRSPYPWQLKQAAVVTYLVGERGYRPVAAGFLLAWQLLWQWMHRLAGQAKALLALFTGLLMRYPPPGGRNGPAPDFPTAREIEAYRAKARSEAKQEGLASIGAMLAQAHRLWQAGAALGLPWGEPDPDHLLGFVSLCQEKFI